MELKGTYPKFALWPVPPTFFGMKTYATYIIFENDNVFSEKYILKSEDKESTIKIFKQELRDIIKEFNLEILECNGEKLLVFTQGMPNYLLLNKTG